MSVQDPFSETPSIESLSAMVESDYPNGEITPTAHEEIVRAHNTRLVIPRAEILAQKAIEEDINDTITLFQLKSIARINNMKSFVQCESTSALLLKAVNDEIIKK